MDPHLTCAAERRYPGGTRVEARFGIPGPGFSVTVLFGPSGSGKTTALRLLAGLERPDAGVIAWGGTVWADAEKGLHLPPQARNVGFLSQAYDLFPHLSLAANLAYGIGALPAAARRASPSSTR